MGNKNSGRRISKESGERYITWLSNNKMFKVSVPYEGKQITLGYYKILNDAVECRDKYLTEFCVNVD